MMNLGTANDLLKSPKSSVAFRTLAKLQNNVGQLSGLVHVGQDLPDWIDRYLLVSALYTSAVLEYVRKGGMHQSSEMSPTRRIIIIKRFSPSIPDLSGLLP